MQIKTKVCNWQAAVAVGASAHITELWLISAMSHISSNATGNTHYNSHVLYDSYSSYSWQPQSWPIKKLLSALTNNYQYW